MVSSMDREIAPLRGTIVIGSYQNRIGTFSLYVVYCPFPTGECYDSYSRLEPVLILLSIKIYFLR